MSRRKNVHSPQISRDATDGDVTIKFSELRSDKPEVDTSDDWYRNEMDAMPLKQICFAVVLFVIGSVCLAMSALIATHHLDSSMDDRMWPMLILGVLMSLPGGYYLGMVICVLMNSPGWSWSRLPQIQ